MPKFFVDTYDGRTTIADSFGIDLGSVEEAADEAAALLPDFAREIIPDGQSHEFAAAVRDEGGAVVYRAALLFRGRFDGPSDTARTRAVRYDAADAIEHSQRLRAEAIELGEKLNRATDDLWGAQVEARTSREASQSAREERLKRST